MTVQQNRKTEVLNYKNPAERWIEALPIGNGRLGGMVYGGVNKDLIQLNEETIWAGNYQDRNNYEAGKALPEIRSLLFDNQIEKATKLARQTMVSNRFDSYQPLGDLTIQMTNTIEYCDYYRQLDIANAIAYTSFCSSKASYRREYFCSAVDQVIVVRYECDKTNSIDMNISLSRLQDARSEIFSEDTIGLLGRCGGNGVSFCGAIQISCENGKMKLNERRREGNEITANIEKADSVTLFIAANSDYNCIDYKKACVKTINEASKKGYYSIRKDHVREYRTYYDRFSIHLSDNSEVENNKEESTFEWLERIKKGNVDPEFTILYLNYNRYLMISSSRPGCLPSNLQGIWNDQMWAPWESDYHTNVNLQINYWPVEGYNLSECHIPLFDWLETLVKPGNLTAEVCYNARGWVVHHASDIWGATSIFVDTFGIWPMGAAWICRHLYEHYCFTQDSDFLKDRAYPLIKGAVRFLLDFMVEAPDGTACPGKLVCNPSHSPENNFIAPDGSVGMFTYGSTMDTEIIYDIGTICLDMIDVLSQDQDGFDFDFKEEINAALNRLPPIKISSRTGGVQEWAEDFEEKEPNHRHVSHLYGIYPGKMISPVNNPQIACAAGQTINRKFKYGYDGQGWSLSWIACIWARLLRPEEAYSALKDIFQNHILHNLFINAHGNPQVGDAQGVSAAILEMLAQSHDDEIVLLPALPKIWTNGAITGMKLRGGYILDMFWKDGILTKATLQLNNSKKEMPIRVQCKGEYKYTKNNDTIVITNGCEHSSV